MIVPRNCWNMLLSQGTRLWSETWKCSKRKVVSQGVLRKYRGKYKVNIGFFSRPKWQLCMVIAILGSGRLECDPSSLDKWLLTFRRNMSSSPSRVYARLEGTTVLLHLGNHLPCDAAPTLQQTGMFVYTSVKTLKLAVAVPSSQRKRITMVRTYS
jgi:hypothetical protein